ncbi:hypothetical protein [uncultured Treponema sp.]|jgi:hypothetical protein|nr:hypothetical protein [uncultured Treponema sp.]DAT90540.1 MAG TPA: hypothetical protein [Caudoviricetes sp.]
MNKRDELVEMFCILSDETQDSILSHVRFSVLAENAVKKQIKTRNPDLKIELATDLPNSLALAVNHG